MTDEPAAVRAALDALPDAMARQLRAARLLILRLAAADPRIGTVEESLKWGEPAYRPRRSGATLRLGRAAAGSATPAILINCRTTLADEMRATTALPVIGDRAVCLPASGPLPEADLARLVTRAFTYHLRG